LNRHAPHRRAQLRIRAAQRHHQLPIQP
jgi:hypothetical protein